MDEGFGRKSAILTRVQGMFAVGAWPVTLNRHSRTFAVKTDSESPRPVRQIMVRYLRMLGSDAPACQIWNFKGVTFWH